MKYADFVMAYSVKTRRPGGALLGALLLFGGMVQLSACGGDLGYTFAEGSGGGGAVIPGSGGTASGGNPFYGSGGEIEEGSGGHIPYEEEQCPEVPPPATVHECDPLDPASSCESYESCIPYIIYPDREDGCGTPGYGEICWVGGSAAQGELCTYLGTGCSPGFMCVLGAAGGERCAQICVPGAANTCPQGLICGETDVLGYGVCY